MPRTCFPFRLGAARLQQRLAGKEMLETNETRPFAIHSGTLRARPEGLPHQKNGGTPRLDLHQTASRSTTQTGAYPSPAALSARLAGIYPQSRLSLDW